MGLPADNEDAYNNSCVIPHLVNLERPLLLMHGMADDNVLFTHSTMLMSELQRLGKSFELMTYPGAKHSMQEVHVSIHRFNTLLDFLIANCDEDPPHRACLGTATKQALEIIRRFLT